MSKQKLAAAFDREIDPLKKYQEGFAEAGLGPEWPFDEFIQERLIPQGLSQETIEKYRTTFAEYREFMADEGRYPACPSDDHIKDYISYLQERNKSSTIKGKLTKLNRVYEFWQAESAFPHGADFNPFKNARQSVDLSQETKEPPRLSLEIIQEKVNGIKHIRDRAIVAFQLKLGIRAGEVGNIQLADIHLSSEEILNYYDDMGTADGLQGHENALYIPHDRVGNKSLRPRILPLDGELRRLTALYLRIRPDCGSPYLFLTKEKYNSIPNKAINKIWRENFSEYDETDAHKAVTSHYGRHFFTTFWRMERELDRDKLKYMRGDVIGSLENQAAIDVYIHSQFQDIEDIYREGIFKLNL